MNNVVKAAMTFLIIVVQTSCASVSNGKDNPFDRSVNGINLSDSVSYVNILGKNIKFYDSENIVYTQHYNSVGDEMLTIISSPQKKFDAIRFQIAKLDKKFLMKRNILKDVAKFVTEKGIRLGMSPIEVIGVFGNQYDKEVDEDGIIIYRYRKKNIGVSISGSDVMGREYKSEYHFYGNKLIEFVFGF